MGFDQYHEPPDELPQETRTFARLCASLTEDAWRLIDDEARARLTPALAARKLVDFAGPHGWQRSSVDLGRTRDLADVPADGLVAAQRQVLAMVELQAPFSVARSELRDAD